MPFIGPNPGQKSVRLVMTPGFSANGDEQLVEEIAKHPSLWELSQVKYKDPTTKDDVWVEISEKIGKQGE